MSEGQLQSQAEEFLQDGAYSLDFVDLAIAALSNMLQTPLVLYTSRPNQPLHIQYPTHSPMLNPNPVCLAYLQYLGLAIMMLLHQVVLRKKKTLSFLQLPLP